MEHSLDSNEFLYDNRRICSKLYIFFKFIGLIFYASILPTCNNHDFFIGMIVAMFLAIINSMRYEYAHFMRYGTIFLSIIASSVILSSLNDFVSHA